MKALNFDNFMSPYKGNTAFNLNPKLNEYKELYFKEYASKILVSCVYNAHNGRYTFFFKFPSSENDKYPTELLYDIIIEFNPPGNKKKDVEPLADIKTYDIYVYSNSPSFIFTFDYVVKTKYGFPHCLPYSYLSKVAITKAPEIRNQFEIMTVEKTTWMCFFHLFHNGYLTKEVCKTIMGKNNESYYLKKVATQPQKLKEIKDLKDTMRKYKEKDKKSSSNNTTSKQSSGLFSSNFKSDFKTDFRLKNDRVVKHISKKNDINLFKNSMFANFKAKELHK